MNNNICDSRDGVYKRTHICRLEITGKFAVNIIDSIIIVHHQASKVILHYDKYLDIINN